MVHIDGTHGPLGAADSRERMDPMTTHIDITDDQIEALRIEAGQAGDSLQIACCVIALADDRDRWARAVSEAKWAQADALWPSPAAARAECARVIADDDEE